MIKAMFCPISSGSSGNCTYISTGGTRILIDAGISGKKIQEGLETLGVDGGSLDALFITHEHVDHIKGAGILSRRFDIPIFATQDTWEAMEGSLGTIARHNRKIIYSGENCVINDMCVKPFSIPHDAADPVGYSVFADNIKMTLATDLGHITEEIRENITGSDVLLLEANHDLEMLRNGPYTWALKKRIMGDFGHISNIAAGELLASVMNERLKHVFLGHLSAENNTPHLAYDTVEAILNNNNIYIGRDLKMDMALRYSVSMPVTF